MAITLTEIITGIRSRVNDDSGVLKDALLIHFINIGQNVVYNQLLPIIAIKLTATAKQNLIIAQSEYSLPTDCRDVRRVRVNGKKALEKSIEEIDFIGSGMDAATTSQPNYLEWAKKIEIYPTPIAAVTNGIRIDYLKQVEPLVSGSDVSIIPEEYHGLIVDYVEGLALRKLDKIDKAQVADQTISKMFGDILNTNAQQMALTELKKEKS